jgi:hypothetical protein
MCSCIELKLLRDAGGICNHTYLLTYLLTPWSGVLEKLAGLQLVKKFPVFFMKPESSLPHSQVPYTCLYPEPAQSSHTPHTTS